MQNVTSDYKDAIRSIDKPYDEVYGTVTFSDNSTLIITPAIIPERTCTISRQCIDGDDLEFGGVYSDQLEMQLITDKSRYAFFGARVVLDYKIMVNGSYEVVHLGRFTISDAERQGDNIKFTAYDDMRLLDKSIPTTALQGYPYDVLNLISLQTGYPISFNEQYVINNFLNTDTDLYLDKSTGISTYRDAVKVVCQVLGCFARDNRQGSMELVKYLTTSADTLTYGDWYDITVADYLCSYIGLTITCEQGTFISNVSSQEVGNVMRIPDAPAWDFGVETQLQLQTDRLFSYLRTITYTPVEVDTIDDPSFDVGDRLTLETADGDTIETIITSYEWTWGGGMTITSKGVNPYMEGASTTDLGSKRLLEKSQAENTFSYYTWTNSRQITLTTTETALADLRFGVSVPTTIKVFHEFKWLNTLVNSTQKITIKFYLDGVVETYTPEQLYGENGVHTWNTIYWLTDVTASSDHHWRVSAFLDSGSAVINVADMRVLLEGQKLMAELPWNGWLEFTVDNNKDDKWTPVGRHKGLYQINDYTGESVLEYVHISPNWSDPTGDDDPDYPPLGSIDDTMGAITRHKGIFGLNDSIVHGAPTISQLRLNIVSESGENIISEDDKQIMTEGD